MSDLDIGAAVDAAVADGSLKRRLDRDACEHHYLIPTPDGSRTTTGVCQKCGDERVMSNDPGRVGRFNNPPFGAEAPSKRIARERRQRQGRGKTRE